MDWSAITRAEWISAGAAAVSCASALFTWRNLRISARKERREIEATRPIVEHYLDHFEAYPRDFIVLRLVVRNRAAHGLVVDAIVSPDKSALLILDQEKLRILKVKGLADEAYDSVMRTSCSATLPDGRYVAPGDSMTIEAVARILKPRTVVQVSLSLSERLPEIRRSTITAKIKLPTATISAVEAMMSAGVSGASQN